MAESWEQLKLEELSIKEAAEPQQQLQEPEQEEVSPPAGPNAAELHLTAPEEQAVLYALAGHNERVQALRIEEDVLAFIGDTARDVLEFPLSFVSYQRLLAHKVAQYHGLQTSTADYEGSTGRVVAHRKNVDVKSRPRLSELVVSPSTIAAATAQQQQQQQQQQQHYGRGSNTSHDHRPKLLQRPSGVDGQRNGPESDRPTSSRTIKDREEEYSRARQRIIGEPVGNPAAHVAPSPFGAVSGHGGSGSGGGGGGRGNGGGGRVGGGGRGGGGLAAGGGFQGGGYQGRGRKFGRGDRSAELQQDPDYMRGTNRFGGPGGAYDPTAAANGYMMPPGGTYGMPYAAEAGRDARGMHLPTAGTGVYNSTMPAAAAAAPAGMHPHAVPTSGAPPPPPPLAMQASMSSSKFSSSASSTPTALLPPPPPPGGPLPSPAAYPGPTGPPAVPPYAAMTSMAMAYSPSMMPHNAPSMYTAMHPAATYPYPHHPQMGMAPTGAYPGAPYPGADPMAAAAAMQGSYPPMMAHPQMHGGYAMMAQPHMGHPGMGPAAAVMGRSMHHTPYPGAMAMPQAGYPGAAAMQQDSSMYHAATTPAAMYHGGAMQPPYGYAAQQHPQAMYQGSSPYGGGGNSSSGGGAVHKVRGRALRDHDSYHAGGGRGRGGWYHNNSHHNNHNASSAANSHPHPNYNNYNNSSGHRSLSPHFSGSMEASGRAGSSHAGADAGVGSGSPSASTPAAAQKGAVAKQAALAAPAPAAAAGGHPEQAEEPAAPGGVAPLQEPLAAPAPDGNC